MRGSTPEAPRPTELTTEALQKKYRQDFPKFLEKMEFPEDVSQENKDKALAIRGKAEGAFERAKLMVDTGGDIPEVWEEIGECYIEYVELRSQILSETMKKRTGTDKEGTPALSEEVGNAYDGDEENPTYRKMKPIVEGLEDDPMSPSNKRYFPKEGQVNGRRAARDEQDILRALKTATPAQRPALEKMLAGVREVGAADPMWYKFEKDIQERKANYQPNQLTAIARLGVAAFSTLMALWSLRAKNTQLTALYGGIAVLAACPGLLDGKDKKMLKTIQKLNSPGIKELREKYLRGEEGAAAAQEFFDLEKNAGPEERKLLKSLESTKQFSMEQVRLICDPDTALYKVLERAKTDEERHTLMRSLYMIDNKDAQKTLPDLIKSGANFG